MRSQGSRSVEASRRQPRQLGEGAGQWHHGLVNQTRGESRPHGVKRRDQIIQAAVELFGETGYQGSSLRDIAARAGITHPGLLYHFGSKEELLAAVLKYRDDLQELPVDGGPALSAQAVIDALFSVLAANQQERAMIEMFATLSTEATDPQHPAHAYFTARYADVRRRFTQYAAVLQREGYLRPPLTPELAATLMVALMDGLQVQWLYAPEEVDMASHLRLFLAGVLHDPTRAAVADQR